MAEAECVMCRQVITHPVCPACLEAEMIDWLRETKPALLEGLREKTDEVWSPHGDLNCVLCKGSMELCTYCYTLHMLAWLQDYPELVPEFVRYFNFDLNYNGYARDLLEVV